VEASVRSVDWPIQTLSVPCIAAGASTFTTVVVVLVPHAFVADKVIVTVPEDTPVTIPVALTVATATLLLAHVLEVPVSVASLNDIVKPTHTVSLPVIVPGEGYAQIITLPFPQVAVLSLVVTVITPAPPV